MNFRLRLLVISYLLSLLSITANATIELDTKSFRSIIQSGKNGMIKFFQSWCGHCTRMKPDWDKLALESPSDVFIADVNCGDNQELCDENGVTGYPTIKYYLDGSEHDYTGGRGYEQLSDFVSEMLATKCNLQDLEGTCSDKAQNYAVKWMAPGKSFQDIELEVKRLKGIMEKSMKPELKKWIKQRLGILTQLSIMNNGSEF